MAVTEGYCPSSAAADTEGRKSVAKCGTPKPRKNQRYILLSVISVEQLNVSVFNREDEDGPFVEAEI